MASTNNKIFSNSIVNGQKYFITISPKNTENNSFAELTTINNMLKDAIKYGMHEFHLWQENYKDGAKQKHYHGWFHAKNSTRLNKAFYSMMMSKEYRLLNTLVNNKQVDETYISKEGNKVLHWNATTKLFNIITFNSTQVNTDEKTSGLCVSKGTVAISKGEDVQSSRVKRGSKDNLTLDFNK